MVPVIEIKIGYFGGIHKIEVSIPSKRGCTKASWVLTSTGKNRFLNQITDPSLSQWSWHYFVKRTSKLEKRGDSDDDDRSFRRRIRISDPWSSSKMDKNPVVLKKNPKYRAQPVLTHERNWKIIPRYPNYQGWSLSAKISRLASKMVRHFDQDEREADGAVHWNSLKSILTRGFRKDGAEKFFRFPIGFFFQEGSNKIRFENCETSQTDLVYVRAIKGNSGGEAPSDELMNHVLLPPKWKDIIYHKCQHYTLCEQNTLTRHIFSHLHALISMSHVTLAQVWLSAHVISCVICMLLLSWYSSTLYSVLSTVSLIFLVILLFFIFIFHMGCFDEKSHAHFS